MTHKILLSLVLLFLHIGIACAGRPEAQEALKRSDFDSAIRELRPLATQGSTEDQILLAQVLLARKENPQSIVEAIDLLRKAAASGNQGAMLILAATYSKGGSVKKDDQESVKWMRKLVEYNNPIGLVILATNYHEGLGVPQSNFIATALFIVSGFMPESILKSGDRASDRMGPVALALVSKLVVEMRKPGNILKALDTANVDAVAFNKKYANLPSTVKDVILDAEAGDNRAIVKIGCIYLYGEAKVPRDPKRAAHWFQMAASKGNMDAKDYLALMHLEGIGVDKNYRAAYKIFSELAKRNSPSAAAELGVMYKDGLGTSQDFIKALYWLRKAIAGTGVGTSDGLYPLAQMYSQGSGVEKNLVVARALAKYSENLHSKSYNLELTAIDNPAALFAQELKSKLSPHDIAVSSNLATQFQFASRDGNLLAVIDLAAKKGGKDYEMSPSEVASHFVNDSKDKNFPLALSLLKPLINSGDPAAQYLLGSMYESGHGVLLDTKKANSFFELAERQGNVDALTRKAGIYERGEGVPQDLSKAFFAFETAAQKGGAVAQVKVADMLADGKGVERNTEKAKFWYEQALANQTDYWHANAREGLAKVYFSEKKYVDAARNFKLAAAEGNKEAQLSLAKMYFDGVEIPRSLQLAYALAKVAQRDEPYRAQASLFSKEVKKYIVLTGQAPLDSLVVTLSDLDRYSQFNKKDSAEFLRVINDFEFSAKH